MIALKLIYIADIIVAGLIGTKSLFSRRRAISSLGFKWGLKDKLESDRAGLLTFDTEKMKKLKCKALLKLNIN